MLETLQLPTFPSPLRNPTAERKPGLKIKKKQMKKHFKVFLLYAIKERGNQRFALGLLQINFLVLCD